MPKLIIDIEARGATEAAAQIRWAMGVPATGGTSAGGSRSKNLVNIVGATEAEVKNETEKIYRTRQAIHNTFYDSEVAANMRAVTQIIQDRKRVFSQLGGGDPEAFAKQIGTISLA